MPFIFFSSCSNRSIIRKKTRHSIHTMAAPDFSALRLSNPESKVCFMPPCSPTHHLALGLIQFEPWQILTTKVLPKRIRQLQRELASSLCEALPPGVLVGQLAQNRFGVLFAGTTVHEAEKQLAELARHGKIALKGIKGIKLHPYTSSAGFPQDAAKIEDLWPLVSQRLFSAFGVKPGKAVS